MNKRDKQLFFEVQLNWITDSRGILSAKDADGTLRVATPPEFGGQGKPWTPEHYFLSAISGCFMTTYLAFCKRFDFEITGLDCDIIGQVEISEGRYKFTNINLYPKIYLKEESLRSKASQAVEKTHKYCLVTNSINAEVFYHTEILIGEGQAVK